MKKLFTFLTLVLFAMTVQAQETTKLIDYPTTKDGITLVSLKPATEGEGTTATTDVSYSTVKVKNVSTDCIKFGKSIKMDDNEKYYAELSVEGGFKSGDVISITGCYNNASEKNAAIAFYDQNKTNLWTTDNFLNTNDTSVEPTAQTFTLTADAEKLFIGRSGNTGTCILELTITRAETPTPPPTPVSTVTDVLTSVGLGAEAEAGSSYVDFTGKTFTSAAVYSANMSAGNVLAIQLRTNNNNSGIVTTTSGGKVKAVKVTWSTSTETGGATNSARSVEIFGSNTAYTAPTDLYGENKGTSLGTLALADATENVSTLEVTGDYEYFGIKSTNGALYLVSVEVTWEGEAAPTMPAAPVPTVPADQVYNLFSDAYGGYSNNYHYVVWWDGQATQEEVELAANDKAWHISNFVFIGSEFDEKNLSNYKALNLDVYPVGANLDLGVAPINAGQDINFCVNRAGLVAGQWNHISIPMEELAATGSTLDRLFQIKLCGLDNANADGTPEFYIDNIFFEKEAGVPDIKPEVPTPYEYNTSCNLMKGVTFDTSKSYFATGSGWTPLPTPEVTVENGTYTYTITEATVQQWQAQMKFISDVATNVSNTYDFSVTIKANQNVNNVTVKLYNNDNNDVFYLSDIVNLKADEPAVIKHEAMAGIDMTDLCILIDAGGNPANTTIQMIEPVLKESSCEVVTLPEVIDYPVSVEGITIGGTTTYDNVKIHTNTDAIDGIKLANAYTTEEVLNANYVTIEVEGGFKAGDVITIAGAFNNSDETKKAAVDIFTLDAEGKPVVLFTTQQFVNGKLSADDPTAETYTLTADYDELYLGRNGNTGTFITLLKTEKGVTPPPAPEKLYIIGFDSWDPTNMVEMTYDATAEVFTYDITLTATGYFAVADMQQETLDWADFNANHRWSIGTTDAPVELGKEYTLVHGDFSNKLEAGSYIISVTKDYKMTVTATDGIRSIENSELRMENYNYYNLAGQRVGKDYKGIVIVNGKKVMVK